MSSTRFLACLCGRIWEWWTEILPQFSHITGQATPYWISGSLGAKTLGKFIWSSWDLICHAAGVLPKAWQLHLQAIVVDLVYGFWGLFGTLLQYKWIVLKNPLKLPSRGPLVLIYSGWNSCSSFRWRGTDRITSASQYPVRAILTPKGDAYLVPVRTGYLAAQAQVLPPAGVP